MKKSTEGRQIGLHGVRETQHRLFREEQAKHRADPIKLVSPAELVQNSPYTAFHLLTDLFELTPSVDSFQFPQLGEPGCHRERIAGKRSSLINWSVGR